MLFLNFNNSNSVGTCRISYRTKKERNSRFS